MAPSKSPSKRSPLSPIRKTERFINEVDLQPTKEIFMTMHGISLFLVAFALAAAFAWVYYVAEAVDNNAIGGGNGNGGNDSATNTAKETRQVNTMKVMFQSMVASSLIYFVVRHHYRSHF